ncbi:uncharacterized protein HaLaN_32366, partial [Haematococcus lacustris]
ADAALAHVMELLPSHHEDMKLIEAMDEMLAAARRKARTELARNAEASSAISAELDKLDALLTSSDAGRVSYSASPGPGTGQSGATAALGSATGLASKASLHGVSGGLGGAGDGGEDVVVGALAQCTTIVESMDKLRSMLYSQARALDFLKSTGLVIQPIDLTLDAAEDVPAASLDRRSGTWGTAAGPAPTAFRPDITLAKDIEAVIDACKHDTS